MERTSVVEGCKGFVQILIVKYCFEVQQTQNYSLTLHGSLCIIHALAKKKPFNLCIDKLLPKLNCKF